VVMGVRGRALSAPPKAPRFTLQVPLNFQTLAYQRAQHDWMLEIEK
jgi:hypothetical protein